MTRRWVRASTTVVSSALLLGGWIAFLARNGLDRADKLSSAAGAVLTAVLGAAGLWATLRSASGRGAGEMQINQASGNATMYNVQGGNLHVGEPADPHDP